MPTERSEEAKVTPTQVAPPGTPGLRQRLSGARRTLALGFFALLAASGALWYGEHAELERVRSLKEGKDDATEVATDMVRPELEGKLVHVTGTLAGHDALHDDPLGIAVDGLRLHRTVEMFQWEEHEEEVVQPGGAKQKVKSYVKTWSAKLVPSRGFEPGHENPSEPPYVDRVVTAEGASLGPFLVGVKGVSQLANFETLVPTQQMIDRAPADVKSRLRLTGSTLYLGKDPGAPDIGDCRIGLQIVKSQPVSILGEQHGAELVSHKTHAGGEVFVVRPGTADTTALVAAADAGTGVLTWSARGVALALLGFGFTLWLAAFGAGGRAAPRMGRFVLPGLVLLGTSCAALAGGVAVGAAWLNEKPVVAGFGFGVAAAGLVASIVLVTRARRARTA